MSDYQQYDDTRKQLDWIIPEDCSVEEMSKLYDAFFRIEKQNHKAEDPDEDAVKEMAKGFIK